MKDPRQILRLALVTEKGTVQKIGRASCRERV